MKFGTMREGAYPLDKLKQISDNLLSRVQSSSGWQAFKGKATIMLPLSFILALALGIGLGSTSETLSSTVNSSAEAFVDGYGYGAPFLIFLVLAPVLSRIFSTRRRGKFGFYVISWLAGTKILALLWAVLFTVVVFGLPILPEDSVSVGGAMVQSFKSLITTLTVSQYFWAIYAAILTGLVAIWIKPLAALLERGVTAIEFAGQYFQPLIPFLMFAIGVYIQSIPSQLEDELGLKGTITSFEELSILGMHIDPNSTAGMVTAYVAGSVGGRGGLLRMALRDPGPGQTQVQALFGQGLLQTLLGEDVPTALVDQL